MNTSAPMPENGKSEVIILAGFLGAGKTTLLRHILSWETDLSDTAVVVNEFGELGIDGSMLKDADTEMVELTSGCICCTLKPMLNAELRRIWDRYHPKRVLIEATGVADPESIVGAFQDGNLQERMTVRKVVTVLDADYWLAREHFGPLFFNQLKDADLILLNKIDLLEEEDLPKMLAEIHAEIPDSQVVPTLHCAVDPETLWSAAGRKTDFTGTTSFFTQNRAEPGNHDHAHHHHEHLHSHEYDDDHTTIVATREGYVAFSFEHPQPLQETSFKRFLEGLPWELFRLKGPVQFQDRTLMLNHVGGKSEWADYDGPEATRLAFVGLKVDPEEIIGRLNQCLATG